MVELTRIPLDIRTDTVIYHVVAGLRNASPGEVVLTTHEALAVVSILKELKEEIFGADESSERASP